MDLVKAKVGRNNSASARSVRVEKSEKRARKYQKKEKRNGEVIKKMGMHVMWAVKYAKKMEKKAISNGERCELDGFDCFCQFSVFFTLWERHTVTKPLLLFKAVIFITTRIFVCYFISFSFNDFCKFSNQLLLYFIPSTKCVHKTL